MNREITQAVDFLATLKVGDQVEVDDQAGRQYTYRVTRPLHRSDGAFGSYESNRVTIQLRPGGYARDLTAEQIAEGLATARKVTA